MSNYQQFHYVEDLRMIADRQELFDASIRKSKSGSQTMDTRNEKADTGEVTRVEAARRRLMRAEEEYKTAVKEENAGVSPGTFGLRTVEGIEPDLDRIFKYHSVSYPDQVLKYKAIRDTGKFFAQCILDNVADCADRTAAIRKIREAVMTANAAIALGGRL